MSAHIAADDLRLVDTEPRVQDLRLAEALGFKEARMIRKLIDRNLEEVARHGEVCSTVSRTSPSGGRPGTEYWLNEPQALVICMLARTDRAIAVRAEIIQVFMAWRRGQMAGELRPWRLPAEAEPLQAYGLKLETVRLAARVHGLAAARRLWGMMELPPVPGYAPAKDDEAQRCLDHMLSTVVTTDAQGRPDRTLRDWIAILLTTEEDDGARKILRDEYGIHVEDGDEAALGFVVASTYPPVARLFGGTAWKESYPYVLRRLPGVRPWKRIRYGGLGRRGTFVPASFLDEPAPPPASAGGNVVPLRPER